ncbi:DNA primase [Marinilactibacillus piezotolerans]|uniref:DNA primase n=1 Tax=Marinilactibacillus piezotolerans TaxID=258723 RepID=A0A1I3YSW2_9LACT|nr:DNA primase [Marinilactibacillus piezotolerans]SFK34321.1 DNA primase [Marinilactibacillus piezotolerans]
MVRIPEETVTQIREKSDIVNVVSQYVQLKKSGQNHFAHCPFHEDKTPSFSVNEKKQIFHCFSCGRGGNVFSFLQEMEGISFPEAVIKSAEIADVPIDQEIIQQSNQSRPNENSKFSKLLAINEKTKEFYHHILINTKVGEAAYQYLLDRGVEKETIEEFQLGFSPPQRNALKLYLDNQEGLDNTLLSETGLFSDREDRQLLDRFSGRIIFPIRDHKGQTVAFSGRIFEGDNSETTPGFHSAKYVNSPETDLFNKRKILFNYDKARPIIRREGEVYLFEGFMDVISSWQAGIRNGIASMGTSLTHEQIQQMDRVTDKVVIAYDGDQAGLEATKRATEYFTDQTHFTIEITSFPEKLDPDDYIKSRGKEAYKDFLLHGRDTLMSFLMKYYRNGKNLKNESERLSYIEQVLKKMTTVNSPVERELYFNQLAQEFKVTQDTLKEQFQQHAFENQKNRTKQLKQQKTDRQNEAYSVQITRQNKPKKSSVEQAEKMLLNRLFYHDEVWYTLQNLPTEFTFPHEHYQILYLLYESYFRDKGENNVEAFLDFIKDPEHKKKATEILWMDLGEELVTGEIEDYIDVISNRSPVEAKLKAKREELKEAERTGDKQKQQFLTIEIINLNRQLKAAKEA